MMVMMMAMTPSLKASIRLLLIIDARPGYYARTELTPRRSRSRVRISSCRKSANRPEMSTWCSKPRYWSSAADLPALRRRSPPRAPGPHTTLLERNGCFGGNITQVGVEGFAWYRHAGTVDSEGIGIEFEERAKAMGAAMPEPQSISYALDAEMFKYVADVLVQEARHCAYAAPAVRGADHERRSHPGRDHREQIRA